MLKIKSKKFQKITAFFKRLPRIMAENAFLTSLMLLVIAMVLGGLAFYKYSILVEQRESELLEKPFYFNEKGFQEVQKIWQERQTRFERADSKEYLNPF